MQNDPEAGPNHGSVPLKMTWGPDEDAERRFRSVFDYAAIGMAVVSLEGRWLQVNAALCELVGLTADELLQRTVDDVMHPDDVPWNQALIRQMLDDEIRTFQRERRYLHANGRVIWALVSSSLVRTADGEPRYVITQMQDITERKLAHEELERSRAQLAEAEEQYRTLVEELPLATFTRPMDMTKPNLYVSPQVETMLGYPAEEWLESVERLRDAVVEEDRERLFGDMGDLRCTGRPMSSEYRIRHRDGHIVWVEDQSYVVRDPAGEPLFVQGFLQDITRRKLAEFERDRLHEELHQAQKLEAVGRLAGGVAHDFNNMLTAIKGYAELLVDALEEGSRQHGHAEQIKLAAEQASTLPRQLLAFSRRQALEPELVELNAVVASTATLLRRLIGGSVDLLTQPSEQPAHAYVDPGQIEQVLFNLALNARDAMPEGGVLTVGTCIVGVDETLAAEHDVPPGPYAVLTVSDTGEGMDAETRTLVFEPFFTTKEAGEGVGLGLASVHGTVTQSGGFILLDTAPGAGATFRVHLPLVDAPLDPELEVAPHAPVVLLAEDERMVRDLARNVLELAGFDVRVAANGAEALELLVDAAGAIDVVLTDITMPGLSGSELAACVAEIEPELPVIFMSGYNDEPPQADDSVTAPRLFVGKPFSPRALVDVVREVLPVPRPPLALVAAPEVAATLTPREQEVLGCLARGLTNERAAVALGISPETVQSHVRNAMGKLEADTRTHAVATALRRSLIA